LGFGDFSSLRNHFWSFTEVVRKIGREVTTEVLGTALFRVSTGFVLCLTFSYLFEALGCCEDDWLFGARFDLSPPQFVLNGAMLS
jgi:hypothetical protein